MNLNAYRESRDDAQARATLPQFVAPQLATLVAAPPTSGDWLYEVKHDGYRMLARIARGEVRLFTRSGKDWTAKLPRLARALAGLGLEASWLDGEIVVPGDGGRSSFRRLQNAFEAGDDSSIVYFVFDAPYLEGEDLTRLPLRARKERLKRKLPAAGAVRFSEHLAGNAAEVLEQACRLGLEGLIGKRADSVYAASPLSGGKIRLLRNILPGKLRERRPGSSCERTCRRSR